MRTILPLINCSLHDLSPPPSTCDVSPPAIKLRDIVLPRAPVILTDFYTYHRSMPCVSTSSTAPFISTCAISPLFPHVIPSLISTLLSLHFSHMWYLPSFPHCYLPSFPTCDIFPHFHIAISPLFPHVISSLISTCAISSNFSPGIVDCMSPYNVSCDEFVHIHQIKILHAWCHILSK